jgi:uncharacterized protein (TIGR01244 family)
MSRKVYPTLLLLLAVSLLPACAVSKAADSTLLPIRNARVPIRGLLSGGQPTPEQIEAAARAGFRTVINLRTDKEAGFGWEREAVEGRGLRYVQIPVGSGGLTRENVERFDIALRQALETGPVLLHCAIGERVGAILALRAAWFRDVDPEKALEFGRANGLNYLEGKTRELLGLAEPAESE